MVIKMEFKKSGQDILEIILTSKELDAWELYPEQLDEQDPLTRKILSRLLHKASEESGFYTGEGEFLIEVSKDKEKTIFRLTRISEPSGQIQVFRFFGSEEMLGGALRLYELIGKKQSSLYQMGKYYYLIVILPKEKIAAARELMHEYGSCALHAEHAAAVLEEHARCLMEDSALSRLNHHFS